jgi:hypothetical protein
LNVLQITGLKPALEVDHLKAKPCMIDKARRPGQSVCARERQEEACRDGGGQESPHDARSVLSYHHVQPPSPAACSSKRTDFLLPAGSSAPAPILLPWGRPDEACRIGAKEERLIAVIGPGS